MSASCCHAPSSTGHNTAEFRRVLWIALVINAAMCVTEIGAGILAGSASLQADALDFLGDSANYFISLAVVGAALRARATAALIKGATMGLLGIWVLGSVVWHAAAGTVPEPITMGWVGTLALVANLVCAFLLYAYRNGDANMQSVWICSRNDVLANGAVLLAALGVFGTGTAWPDLIVATVMAVMSTQGATVILRRARVELRQAGREVPATA